MPTNITRADATSSVPTLAEQMVAKLQAEILAGSGGVVQTTVDGVTVQVSRSQMLKELTFWEKKVARASGTRPLSPQIQLNHASDDS
jgi:hypothetical protein|tara:strand:- start:440 stop:700 length:261 start_codon:yes stop_codon:yes gene_type:complete